MRELHGQRFFTLIELLVVVSVIAVLTSLLLPALGSARGMAKSIKCAGNMRQIAVAAFGYIGDWDEWLPASNAAYSDVYYGRCFTSYLGPSVSSSVSGACVPKSGITVCPAESRSYGDAIGNTSALLVTNYIGTLRYNAASTVPAGVYAGWQHHYNCHEMKKLRLVTDSTIIMVEMPARCLDGAMTGLWPATFTMAGYTNSLYDPWNVPYWHNGGANFLWKDGHIDRFKAGTQFTNDWQLK